MRRRFIFGLAVLSTCIGGARPADAVPPESPFAPILARNVFGLRPGPTTAQADSTTTKPPVKIIPNGIMTLFGKSQVLFKVLAAPIPGQPTPQEQSYLMSEGESRDGIEVKKIEALAAVITFDNHGLIQRVSLISTSAAGGSQDTDSPGAISQSRLHAASHLALIRRTAARNADTLNNADEADAGGQFNEPNHNSPTSVISVPASLSSTPEYYPAPVNSLAPQPSRSPAAANNLPSVGTAQINSSNGEALTPTEAAGGDVPPLSQ